MKVTTAGIDLAKNVFQVHGADEHGKTVLRKQLKREQPTCCASLLKLPLVKESRLSCYPHFAAEMPEKAQPEK